MTKLQVLNIVRVQLVLIVLMVLFSIYTLILENPTFNHLAVVLVLFFVPFVIDFKVYKKIGESPLASLFY